MVIGTWFSVGPRARRVYFGVTVAEDMNVLP